MPTNEMRSAAGCSSIPHLLRNSNPRPIARTCSSISEAGILLISPFRFASVADPAKACAVSRPQRGSTEGSGRHGRGKRPREADCSRRSTTILRRRRCSVVESDRLMASYRAARSILSRINVFRGSAKTANPSRYLFLVTFKASLYRNADNHLGSKYYICLDS